MWSLETGYTLIQLVVREKLTVVVSDRWSLNADGHYVQLCLLTILTHVWISFRSKASNMFTVIRK